MDDPELSKDKKKFMERVTKTAKKLADNYLNNLNK